MRVFPTQHHSVDRRLLGPEISARKSGILQLSLFCFLKSTVFGASCILQDNI